MSFQTKMNRNSAAKAIVWIVVRANNTKGSGENNIKTGKTKPHVGWGARTGSHRQ